MCAICHVCHIYIYDIYMSDPAAGHPTSEDIERERERERERGGAGIAQWLERRTRD